jgi:hypothetical protein
MELANWLISVFVGMMLFMVYVMEFLRNGGDVFGRPRKAAVRVVDPHVLYARRRRLP